MCRVERQSAEWGSAGWDFADATPTRRSNDLGFLNTSRSQKIVHEVWARNQEGRLCVDWLDVVAEYDWELFLV